jgi:hypothetical protein
MKKLACIVFIAFCTVSAVAQTGQVARQKIAVFAPLYLDSAFDGSSYKFDKAFPKFLNAGIEFYQGVQLAIDSLQRRGAPLEVFIYDSRSKRIPLTQRFTSAELKDLGMIIANASSTEVKQLAEEAARRKIPFISATLPNDAGITANPYVVVLNSTLRTHAEGIYQYLQKYHRNDNIVLFRKNGVQENLLRDYFTDAMKSTTGASLRISFTDINPGFDLGTITSKLDSTRRNVCIIGSLEEGFGNNVLQQIAGVSSIYPTTVVGMPTWDLFNLAKPEYKTLEIVYTTPFSYNRSGGLAGRLNSLFEEKINSRPTDLYFRGYETMLRFSLLLLDTKKDVASNLSRKGNNVFTQFDIQPVFLNKSNMTLDYFENKKLYYIKYVNGVRAVVNL